MEQLLIDQPTSFVKSGQEHKVYKLKKALCRLKQAPKAWYNHIDACFLKHGFVRCTYVHTLYVKHVRGKLTIVCLC